jgi:hypothetical protein
MYLGQKVILFIHGNAPCDINNGNANVEKWSREQSFNNGSNSDVQFNLLWHSLPSAGCTRMYVASHLAYAPRLERPEKEQLLYIVVL